MARELTHLSTDQLLDQASQPEQEGRLAEAVAELVMRYKSVVYNQALAVCSGNPSLADDVFQETFLRLFTWLKRRKGKAPLHSFARLLHVFSKRAAIDLIRKNKLREPPPSPESDNDWENRFYVMELLERLDKRSQEVLRLTYFEGLSAPEIAKLLNVKAGHVRILRFRAIEALREWQNRDRVADTLEEL
jgi:RNA polymerase sigma factor (sigma-70 family)